MTDQDRNRIDGYLKFLKSTFRFLLWTGVGLIVIGVLIGLTTNGTHYFSLSPGFTFIGVVLTIRSIYEGQRIPLAHQLGDRAYFNVEVNDLVSKIKFFSLFLILAVMACIVVGFVIQWRFLIPTLVVLVLYVVSEYIIWTIIRFRLVLLKQELKIEE
ncbi:MAG: hypothetical protein HKN68_11345 [Saprospiraceae bacterium]|nr:hypothetical protein [Saprospiraceae bacterium]